MLLTASDTLLAAFRKARFYLVCKMSRPTSTTRSTMVSTTLSTPSLPYSSPGAGPPIVSLNLPPTTPPLQLGDDARIPPATALRQAFIRTNPLYANSFGDKAFERRTSYGLSIIGWRVIGRVQQRWERLEPSLLSLLVARKEILYSKRPPGLITDPPYMLRCFLLGPNKDHATPHATVLCGEMWLRKAMVKLIRKSGLLVLDGFKFCGLPDTPELYGKMLSEHDPPENPESACVHGRSNQIRSTTRPLEGFGLRYKGSSHSTGQSVPVEILQNGTLVREASIGGAIKIDNELFEVTVRHVFQPPTGSPHFGDSLISHQQTPTSHDPPDLEIEFYETDFEDSDDDIEPPFPHPTPSQHSPSSDKRYKLQPATPLGSSRKTDSLGSEPTQRGQHDMSGGDNEDEDDKYKEKIETRTLAQSKDPSHRMLEERTPSTRLGRVSEEESEDESTPILAAPDPRLDWALRRIRLRNKGLPKSLQTLPMIGSDIPETAEWWLRLFISTPSHLIRGKEDSTGIMGSIPVGTALNIPPQRVQVMVLEEGETVYPGECGSWAVDRMRHWVGMVVGSCKKLREVYLLRTDDILGDISQQTGRQVEIASSSDYLELKDDLFWGREEPEDTTGLRPDNAIGLSTYLGTINDKDQAALSEPKVHKAKSWSIPETQAIFKKHHIVILPPRAPKPTPKPSRV